MTRVLVVDDEIDTLNLLRTILEISGYQAVTTLNSVEAITLAEVERPDCILLDIMMPKLDGFTLCKMMRIHPATMNLPIIFVTAYSALDLEDRRREAGADMILPKPVGMDILVDTLQKASQLRAAPSAGGSFQPPTPTINPLATQPAAAVVVPPVEPPKPTVEPPVELPKPAVEQPTVSPAIAAVQPAVQPVVESAAVQPAVTPVPTVDTSEPDIHIGPSVPPVPENKQPGTA